MDSDTYFLKKTFQLAKRAEGFTSPNPLVGAVIVKNKKIISWGYHKKAGFPHAETEAMKKVKEDLRGSTLYVNLEPCCHFGRTPPCVDEIIKRKIERVVIATIDPNPQVRGNSIKKLKRAGVKVRVGLYEDEAKKLNEVFFKNILQGKPFVVVKVAQSLDGKIATKRGYSRWVTGKRARVYAKSLRDRYDCVLIGAGTAIKDNPRLDGLKKIPQKAVIDLDLRIPLNSYLLKHNPDKLVIFTSFKSRKKAEKISLPVKVFFLDQKEGWVSLRKVLKILYNLGVRSVFVEGGSETIGRFFDEKLVDKVYFFISSKILGGKTALTSVGAEGFTSPNFCPSLREVKIKRLDEDILISGYPRK